MNDIPVFWLVVGFLGQAFFSGRFLLQWLASEKEKRSVMPVAFWFFSLVGSILLLIYAVHRRDPVFILGQSTGFLIYSRNIQFIFREKRASAARLSGETAFSEKC